MAGFADWRTGILAVYAFGVGAMMIWAGEPGEIWWWPLAAGFWCSALLPVALLCTGSANASARGMGALLIAGFGLYSYGDSMVGLFGAEPNSTSALIFLFLPAYQLAAALAWMGGLWMVGRLRQRGESV